MEKEDVVKVLKVKEKLENEVVDDGNDVGDFSFNEWADMICEELNIK